MMPTVGRVLHYRLSATDAEQINRRRGYNTFGQGTQQHVGNSVVAGEVVPLIVVRVWPHEFGDQPGVNGQVLLDGNDSLWVTSVGEGLNAGQWSWPPRAEES